VRGLGAGVAQAAHAPAPPQKGAKAAAGNPPPAGPCGEAGQNVILCRCTSFAAWFSGEFIVFISGKKYIILILMFECTWFIHFESNVISK
jgi:hypothetical protein